MKETVVKMVTEPTVSGWEIFLNVFITLAVCLVAYYVGRKIILMLVEKMVRRSRNDWDDRLLKRKFFHRLAMMIPLVALYQCIELIYLGGPEIEGLLKRVLSVLVIFVGVGVVMAFLNALVDIYREFEISNRVPIKAFVQVVQILVVIVAVILAISIVLDKKPGLLLGGIGAFTAVLMLIFKDAILGLVAGVQLTSNDMVRQGDWIDMPKYGADGDVIDVGLMTVKVQNWDKTISSIPSYALVSDSFKNWRGMSESGGRRIKRAIYLDMTSVRFCDEAMLERFNKIQLLKDYLKERCEEIEQDNQSKGVDLSDLANGRRMTNVGTFREYIKRYLGSLPKVHQEGMTFLVRQLAPNEKGLPIEIYVFCNDTRWVFFEGVQADIFDHLIAVVPEFGLRIFQSPSGYDIASAIREIK